MMKSKINMKYEIWVAEWGKNLEKPKKYNGKWDIWQHTSDGHIDGVQSQRVDLDFSNKNYPDIIKSKGKNGY